jgi:hypothetical protein
LTSKKACATVLGWMGRPGAETRDDGVSGLGLATWPDSTCLSPEAVTTRSGEGGAPRIAGVGCTASGVALAFVGAEVLTLRGRGLGPDLGAAEGVCGTREAGASASRRRETRAALGVSSQ